jgi:signal transduction histidine kinase
MDGMTTDMFHLQDISLFSYLDKQKHQEIIKKSNIEHYSSGEVILFPESFSGMLAVVLSGEVAAMENKAPDQQRVKLMRYSIGHFFDVWHPASGKDVHYVKALQDSTLLIIPHTIAIEIIAHFLQKLPFFKDLTNEQLKSIARIVHLESHNAGDILFRQGDNANSLYIVISGEVAMILRFEEEDTIIDEEIAVYGQGSSFGERGVLGDRKRAATAKIKERTQLITLTVNEFRLFTAQHADVAVGLYRYFADELEQQSIAYWRAARDNEKMKELIQSAKMAALGQLVAGIAHEINTPVGSISSNSSQLQDILDEAKECYETLYAATQSLLEDQDLNMIVDETGNTLDAPTKKMIAVHITQLRGHAQRSSADWETHFEDMKDISRELQEASSRIRDMVRSLANFARLDEAEHKAADIHEGLEATLSLLRHELKYKVDVGKDYDENLPEIVCYPNQLNQVFMNILVNAIQALELDKLPDGQRGNIQVKTYQQHAWAVITISDNGKGISRENLDKIFDPYFSTKDAGAAAGGLGLGLGLSISHKIVCEKHGGKLEVESAEGKGTTFFIKLPLEYLTPGEPERAIV